jgi:hypothetical protein
MTMPVMEPNLDAATLKAWARVVDALALTTGWAGGDDDLLAVLHKFQDIGTDEVHLIPTSSNIDQLRRVADVVTAYA